MTVRQMPWSQFGLNECSATERKTMVEIWKKPACVFKSARLQNSNKISDMSLSNSTQEYCSSLNKVRHHNLGSGTIRRCGFVGLGMTLLEEVYHCGGGI